jgi:8-oxo-dGTP pyrophosphatase MutT (NUDIX family)
MNHPAELTREAISGLLNKALHVPPSKYHEAIRFPEGLLPEPPRKAAVLVPFLIKDNSWHILFTRRTASLPEHSDQVAFPGGRSEPTDVSPAQTALREAQEEINLNAKHVLLLGQLKEIRTITNYCVTPVVGEIPWPYEFQLATEEVSRVFTIPLDWLADPANHSIQFHELPPPYSPVPVIYFEKYDGELLWGVSAHIMLDLLEALEVI